MINVTRYEIRKIVNFLYDKQYKCIYCEDKTSKPTNICTKYFINPTGYLINNQYYTCDEHKKSFPDYKEIKKLMINYYK